MGKGLSVTDDKNVAKLHEADRRYTYDEIAYELDIIHGLAYCILTEFANEGDRS